MAWEVVSPFFHVTVVPALTVMALGSKAKSLAVMALVATGAAAAAAVVVVAPDATVVLDEASLLFLSLPHAAPARPTMATSTTAASGARAEVTRGRRSCMAGILCTASTGAPIGEQGYRRAPGGWGAAGARNAGGGTRTPSDCGHGNDRVLRLRFKGENVAGHVGAGIRQRPHLRALRGREWCGPW